MIYMCQKKKVEENNSALKITWMHECEDYIKKANRLMKVASNNTDCIMIKTNNSKN